MWVWTLHAVFADLIRRDGLAEPPWQLGRPGLAGRDREKAEEERERERETHIYIYIYAVKSRFWPSFTLFKVNILAKSKSIFWPRSFSHYKNRGFRRFFGSVIIVCVCVCFFVPNYLAIF